MEVDWYNACKSLDNGSIQKLEPVFKVMYYIFIYNVVILGALLFVADVVPWWAWVIVLFWHVFVAGIAAILAYPVKIAFYLVTSVVKGLFYFLFEGLGVVFKKLCKSCNMPFTRLYDKLVETID
ncbi:MAG: hypothetical protein OXU73_01365 [Candidatus Campbellbacteria bacterium]|nr:hypothetical protein [Candidatus Campbellbacteria bacterium]